MTTTYTPRRALGSDRLSRALWTLAAVLLALCVSAVALAQPKPRPGADERERSNQDPVKADPRDRLVPDDTEKKDAEAEKEKTDVVALPVHHLSGDGIGAFPVGDWADAVGVGLGAGLRYDFDLNERWTLVLEGAYVYHFENEVRDQTDANFTQTITEMLLLFGGAYDIPLPGADDRLFVLAMAGLNWLTIDTAFEDSLIVQDSVVTNQEWALFFGGGYSFERFSLRAGLLISAIGRDTHVQLVNESPLADYTGTMSAVGMFGYHFHAF